MKDEDKEFLAEIINKSHWLFYGELDALLDPFVLKVFEHEFKDYGFEDVKMDDTFATAYWLFLSELVALRLAEYGTSPRGAWLTPDGERFKALCLEHKDALSQAEDYIYQQMH